MVGSRRIGASSHRGHWQLAPNSAIQDPSCSLLVFPAPLFEEEGDACLLALIAEVQYPGGIHRSRLGPGFPPDDDPADAAKVKVRQRTQERFKRKKLDVSAGVSQETHPAPICSVLHAYSHPHI